MNPFEWQSRPADIARLGIACFVTLSLTSVPARAAGAPNPSPTPPISRADAGGDALPTAQATAAAEDDDPASVATGATVTPSAAQPQPTASSVPGNPKGTSEDLAERLYVTPSSYDFSANPKLLARIQAGPHGYFRFINVAFSEEVCRRVVSERPQMIRVNLHGDAHVEQYAVTELGRGLTDFDDSSSGPIALDLMRFAVSIRLVCRAHGWSAGADESLREFLRGYRAALRDPKLEAPEPSLVTQIRSEFKSLSPDYFAWVASLMDPLPPDEQHALEDATATYIDAMKQDNPEFRADYFGIVRVGGLRIGIGSALDKKYLMQIRGPSDNPLDDVVLELKHVRDLSDISCISTASNLDPFRVLVGQARISYAPFRLLGYVRLGGENFWVHAWVANYRELDLSLFATQQELNEVVYDVGVQLGRGHPKQIANPFGVQFRREISALLDLNEARILEVAREFEREIVAAWERFCAESR